MDNKKTSFFAKAWQNLQNFSRRVFSPIFVTLPQFFLLSSYSVFGQQLPCTLILKNVVPLFLNENAGHSGKSLFWYFKSGEKKTDFAITPENCTFISTVSSAFITNKGIE